jgi:hypothetical protein
MMGAATILDAVILLTVRAPGRAKDDIFTVDAFNV